MTKKRDPNHPVMLNLFQHLGCLFLPSADAFFIPVHRMGFSDALLIKGSLSASGRDLQQAFSLEEVETFVLAASHRQNKKPFYLRPLRLCGEQKIR
jgi:hypothetical protein